MNTPVAAGSIPLFLAEGESLPSSDLSTLTVAWLGHPDIRRRLALVPLWIDQDDPHWLAKMDQTLSTTSRPAFQRLAAAAYYLSRVYLPEWRWRRPAYQPLQSFPALAQLGLPEEDGFHGERGLRLLREKAPLTGWTGDWVAGAERMVRVYLNQPL